ncbi:MAG: hypothetical protein DRI57_24455 [Deltaproteobacteria bacterium]|nr:MAG: hypothetical protein DRI57_24455 [Deltaproteobacteria bacterium]
MGMVVVLLDKLPGSRKGKPTVCNCRKAAVPDATWPASGTPPGSETGACVHRGGPGTWESRLSPCGERKVSGDPARRRNPGITEEAPPL